jgi:hypothetical protein
MTINGMSRERSFHAIMAPLMAPIEIPAIQSEKISASARAS